MQVIDEILDKVTMYRLILYFLFGLLAFAFFYSLSGLLSFTPFELLASSLVFFVMCWATNTLFSRIFNVPANVESVYITALILILIVSPSMELKQLINMGWISILAISSKYILAINKKHIFNPVAIAVALSSFAFGASASWWVGTALMSPLVLFGGLLIVKKIDRVKMVVVFVLVVLMLYSLFSLNSLGSLPANLMKLFTNSSLLFLATVMLTEPLTTPPTAKTRLIYSSLTGILFLPQVHLGNFYTTPEIALVIANLYSFCVSPRAKLIFQAVQRKQIAPEIYDFLFAQERRLEYKPGQYMEWTLPHDNQDSRGMRRFLTLASSPTEPDLRLGIRFSPNGSSFKKQLLQMDQNQQMVAGSLAGDFVLPDDPKTKLVFLAGGIGITPFRSIIKFCSDTNDRRSIVLFYSNKSESDIVYKDVFDEAQKKVGIQTVYTLTDLENVSSTWTGEKGRVNGEMVRKYVPDFADRVFYLSGPHKMVVKRSKIKKDYFPGL